MRETEAELDTLQQLLDTSLSRSTRHLRAIVLPGERTLTARQVAAATTGMCTVTVATVTAAGEPRISAVDGHLLHGQWVFSTDRTAAKAQHLLARPAASLAYVRGEEIGVFTHGHVVTLNPVDGDPDPAYEEVLAYLTAHYGGSPLEWGDIVLYRLEPTWSVAYATDPSAFPDQVSAPPAT